ncbi:MAG TPA: glycosyltransferase family 39 protein [Chloroflexota bacterium]|nr:glycosyltransferase family 39 protein [Chloroflexota bacterium]HUM68973.1 glycosyltransferase family 39 protein [Chloroflexota bacterium]
MNTPVPHAIYRSRLIWLTAVLWLGFGLRLYRLDGQSLWWDEMATVARAAIPLQEMFADLLRIRNHMPLYFLVIRLWAMLGYGAFIMRYFSLIWGVLSLPLIYQVGRLLGSKTVGFLAMLLLAVSPFHIWYSQEARMYTFLAFTLLLAHWFLLRTFPHPSLYNWVGYALAMLIALYTHYLAALILIAHYAFFAWHYRRLRSHFRSWLAAAGSVGLLFGLWFGYMMLTGGFRDAPISWIPPATWVDPILTLLAFSAGPSINPAKGIVFLPLIFMAMGMGVCLARYGRLPAIDVGKQDIAQLQPYFFARLLFFWLTIPLLLLLLISLDLPVTQKRSIYMDRYLIIILPALLLLAAWGFALLTEQKRVWWLLPLTYGAIVLFAAASLNNMYHNPHYARTDWRAAIAQLETLWQAGDTLVIDPSQILPLAYYATRDNTEPIVVADVTEMNRELFTTAQRIWVMEIFENVDQHGFPQKRNQQLANERLAYHDWLANRFPIVQEWEYTGIRLTLFDAIP